ncbi:MAG: NUDIX hydrolase [Betaproteobacteria bacterium]|nr:NUDIX hydrolase [Betaproteobacteria bacterium]
MKDFTETALHKEQVYQGKFLRLNRDSVRLPNGRQSVREYLSHPGAAMVVPVLDDGRVIMVRQYRYAVSRHIMEFPAGKIDGGETGEMAARRELLEETGYEAATCEHLYSLHPSVAYVSEQLEFFRARGLRYVGHSGEENEFVEVIKLPVVQALEMMKNGEITDIKAVLGLLHLAREQGI